eukprot:TRINITY_DN75479_c0_g1_i1.p1 TRINITY_DN75479_c0_g1~~TRINITY_DN75479_c0_g1_i1.p1  ORF type:complete len:112 (+),score=20.93 TRINITY_DN75479_c0_g1_i1:68-403(+)
MAKATDAKKDLNKLDGDEDTGAQPTVDSSKLSGAFSQLATDEKQSEEEKARFEREKKLAAIKCDRGDIELVAAQFELDPKVAQRRLQEHDANLKETLLTLIHEPGKPKPST